LRRAAISALGAIGDPETVKPLIDLLKDADAGLRGAAVASLEQLGDQRSLKPLIRILTSKNEDIFVRRLAGRGIVKIDRDTAFGPLARLVEDKTESAPVRRMAAENLRAFRDERPLTPFTKALKDQKSPLWLKRVVLSYLMSVSHLRRFRYSDAYMEALKLAADDRNEEIAKKAREKLEQLKTKLADDLHTIRPRLDAEKD
jgi:HEAT repeat protein